MPKLVAVLLLSGLACCGVAAVNAAPPSDPAKLVTLADVEKALGGKFKVEVPEPGMVQYIEEGGIGRVVEVFLTTSERPKLDDLKANVADGGEPVEDVPGVGDGAMYRPQHHEAMSEKVAEDRSATQLAVAVQNAANDAKAKENALALLRAGTGRF